MEGICITISATITHELSNYFRLNYIELILLYALLVVCAKVELEEIGMTTFMKVQPLIGISCNIQR